MLDLTLYTCEKRESDLYFEEKRLFPEEKLMEWQYFHAPVSFITTVLSMDIPKLEVTMSEKEKEDFFKKYAKDKKIKPSAEEMRALGSLYVCSKVDTDFYVSKTSSTTGDGDIIHLEQWTARRAKNMMLYTADIPVLKSFLGLPE
jgi:hypothetical protein